MSRKAKKRSRKPSVLTPKRTPNPRSLKNLRPAWKKGESGNPVGRPKTLISDATRDWLKQVDPKKGKTNAELVAIAQVKKALTGDTSAYNAVADRTEGKPAQTQQHEVISNSPLKVQVEAPDLISALRQIYGLSGGGASDSKQPAKTVSVSESVDRGSIPPQGSVESP